VSPLGKRHAGTRLESRKTSRPDARCLSRKYSRLLPKAIANARRLRLTAAAERHSLQSSSISKR
jgi:hypothetical protein